MLAFIVGGFLLIPYLLELRVPPSPHSGDLHASTLRISPPNEDNPLVPLALKLPCLGFLFILCLPWILDLDIGANQENLKLWNEVNTLLSAVSVFVYVCHIAPRAFAFVHGKYLTVMQWMVSSFSTCD